MSATDVRRDSLNRLIKVFQDVSLKIGHLIRGLFYGVSRLKTVAKKLTLTSLVTFITIIGFVLSIVFYLFPLENRESTNIFYKDDTNILSTIYKLSEDCKNVDFETGENISCMSPLILEGSESLHIILDYIAESMVFDVDFNDPSMLTNFRENLFQVNGIKCLLYSFVKICHNDQGGEFINIFGYLTKKSYQTTRDLKRK